MGGNRGVGGNLPNGHFFVDFFHGVFSGILKFKIPTRPHICLNGWYRSYISYILMSLELIVF